ncbi:uncharacterized protein LOC119067681 [Bradysia coprophila]|uniref:uncharacterized protein LOC119067681 n=1 Tax=Bradysia coprophila TaxID=38358 RepID=UPI00187DB57A|nr:uncharacterized protein LOC119067681 [Bradysia coprophila]
MFVMEKVDFIQQKKMSITVLNDDCLHKCFESLEIDDCMNVAEVCKRFAGVMQPIFRKKFSLLSLKMKDQYDKDFIDRVLYHISDHLKSLAIGSEGKSAHLLARSTSNENLKSLILRHWKLSPTTFSSELTNFQHIKSMSSNQCNLRLNRDFFTSFRNIEIANFRYCRGVHNKSITKFFETNDKIKSVTIHCLGFHGFPLGSLALLPRLEQVNFLGLVASPEYLIQLSQIRSLKRLKLSTRHLNSSYVMGPLLLHLDWIEGLEIKGFRIDENVFASLQKMHSLKLFGLTFPSIFFWKWKPAFTLPSTITDLKLESVHISAKQIASIICELPKLQKFHVNAHPQSIIDNNNVKIDDFETIVNLIFDALDIDASKRYVKVTLINAKYSSEELRLGSLQFFGIHPSKSCFGIDFPDFNRLLCPVSN